jgi:hypothetical protein
MKRIALSLLSVMLVLPLVTVAAAQSTPDARPPGAAPAPSSQAPANDASTAPADRPNDGARTEAPRSGAPDLTIQNRTDVTPDASGSALPRSATERTTVFGLSPTAAVILGAALLVVVVLAIVAMSRNASPDIDTRPRV